MRNLLLATFASCLVTMTACDWNSKEDYQPKVEFEKFVESQEATKTEAPAEGTPADAAATPAPTSATPADAPAPAPAAPATPAPAPAQ